MDKVFELLGRIFPLLQYYPRWMRAVTAVTFALILLTVFLLALGYSSAAQMRDWETQIGPVIEKQAETVEQLFSQLGSALSALHTSGIQLRFDLLAFTKGLPDLSQYMRQNPHFLEKKTSAPLREDTLRFLEDLGRLREALKSVQADPMAQDCWLRSNAANNGALAYLGQQLTDRGFDRGAVSVQISKIPQILQFLSLAPSNSHLGGLKFDPLITAILATNIAETSSVGKPYQNEALRVLVFEGNLIASLNSGTPDQGKMVLASIGAAILLDIFNSIPDGQILRDVLTERNNKYSGQIAKMPVRFDRDGTVSNDFKFAAESLSKRLDVLVLDLPA